MRDALLGHPVKDWDLEAYGLDVDGLASALSAIGRVDTVGRAFGVLKVRPRGYRGPDIDVSLPRRDSKVGPGHRGIAAEGVPDLDPVEAARRRDLTVNAMAVDLATGALVDPFGGQQDLEAGCLRAVDPTTFLEDPLRALRAAQFVAQLGFDADPTLVELCRSAPLAELPAERLFGEVERLFGVARWPGKGHGFAVRAELWHRAFGVSLSEPDRVDALDRAVPLRQDLAPAGRRLALMFTVWLRHSPTPGVVLDRLGVARQGGYPLRRVVDALLDLPHAPTATDADLRHLSARCELGLWLAAAEAETPDAGWSQRRAHATFLGIHEAPPEPLLMGRHLASHGVAPGPQMGALLQEAYRLQLDGTLTTPDEALRWGLEHAGR